MIEQTCDESRDFIKWLTGVLACECKNATTLDVNRYVDGLAPQLGDAGFRRYFVFSDSEVRDFIAVISPPKTEKNQEFVAIAELLRRGGVNVPAVIAVDFERGFFLLQKLGASLYLDHLDSLSADELYLKAIHELLVIQRCPPDRAVFSRYSQALLRQEMQLFCDWFVTELLQHRLSSAEQSMLERVFSDLEKDALAQPQVIVHRDYHSRNIVYGDQAKPGIIDFQDAVVGPVTYDLVSLLKDCYIAWPQQRVHGWVQEYLTLANQQGIVNGVDTATFLRWFDWMGLQRHIKVLGIFARLFLRDNKPRYLNDLPLVISYTRTTCKKYPSLAEFVDWFDASLMPLIAEQPWMQEANQ